MDLYRIQNRIQSEVNNDSRSIPQYILDTVQKNHDRILDFLRSALVVDLPDMPYNMHLLSEVEEFDYRGNPLRSKSCFTEECSDDTDSLVTETVYDTTMNLYPTKVTQGFVDGDLVTDSTYDMARGLPLTVTASKGGQWTYRTYNRYDKFGRLEQVSDLPRSESEVILKKITYDDETEWIKTEALTGNGWVEAIDHVDGLGRVSHKVAGPYDGKYIYTGQAFNDVGQVIKTWHPIAATLSTDPDAQHDALPTLSATQTCSSEPFCTETRYDPLGRQNVVIGADGTRVESRIKGPTVVALGPDIFFVDGFAAGVGSSTATYLGHVQTREDGWGNPLEVREFCTTENCGSTYSDNNNVFWASDSSHGFYDVSEGGGSWVAPTNKSNNRGTYYQYEYRPNGKGEITALLRQITDVRNNSTFFEYDGHGRRTQLKDPDAGVSTYEYDFSGNILKQIDARGVEALFTYNQGLLGYASYADETNMRYEYVTNTYGDDSFCPSTYRGFTRPNMLAKTTTSMNKNRDGDTNSSLTVSLCYDGRGRVVEKTYEFELGEPYTAIGSITETVKYTWNIDGSIATIKVATQTISYTYCGEEGNQCSPGQLIGIEGSDGTEYVKKITYSEDGQMTGIWYGNTRFTKYEYIPENLRLKKIVTCTQSDLESTSCSASTTIQALDYSCRAGGDIYSIDSLPTEKADVNGDEQEDLVSNATTTLYEYDGLDRLIEAKATLVNQTGDPCLYHQKYSYDTIGNMRTKQELCNRDGGNTKYAWTFNYAGGSYGPHQLSSVSIDNDLNNDGYVDSGYETPGESSCSDGACTLALDYDEAGNTVTNCNPHNAWCREMAWTPRGQMEAVSYCPDESSCNGLEFLYDYRNLRYLKFQSGSVKSGWDTTNPSWTAYVDKLFEFGVRDMNTDLTGPLDQQEFVQLHIFMGGVDPATGDVAPGTRRIATTDVDYSIGPIEGPGIGCGGEARIVPGSNDLTASTSMQILLLLIPFAFFAILRRRRYGATK
jgi:YD repeat-containing protein